MGNFKNIKELKYGMILEDDVINFKTGAILVPQNAPITEVLIQNSIKHGIDKVKIKENSKFQNPELMKKPSKLEKEEFEIMKE